MARSDIRALRHKGPPHPMPISEEAWWAVAGWGLGVFVGVRARVGRWRWAVSVQGKS